MKAPPFDYRLARTSEEAFALLTQPGKDVRLLAGGQSLIAALNLRLSQPDLLLDISRIPDWKGIRQTGAGLTIGALTTHAEIARSDLVKSHAPLLALAAPFIAHPAIRNSGTLGGSLCLADPAAEWPACLVALDATLVAERAGQMRKLPARSFFQGLYETALEPGEILTCVELPARESGDIHLFDEYARRPGDFAIAGLAMSVRFTNARISKLDLGFLGLGATPLQAPRFAQACLGLSAAEACERAKQMLGEEIAPSSDHHASADYRAHLSKVLTMRLLKRAADHVEQGS